MFGKTPRAKGQPTTLSARHSVWWHIQHGFKNTAMTSMVIPLILVVTFRMLPLRDLLGTLPENVWLGITLFGYAPIPLGLILLVATIYQSYCAEAHYFKLFISFARLFVERPRELLPAMLPVGRRVDISEIQDILDRRRAAGSDTDDDFTTGHQLLAIIATEATLTRDADSEDTDAKAKLEDLKLSLTPGQPAPWRRIPTPQLGSFHTTSANSATAQSKKNPGNPPVEPKI